MTHDGWVESVPEGLPNNDTSPGGLMIVLIDNYDSFAHNLARYLTQLGQRVSVHRNDMTDVSRIERMAPQAIVLSPGPCTPNEAGCCLDVVKRLGSRVPVLGVCLGHQVIAQASGGRIVRSNRPVHGCSSQVHHDGKGVFRGLPVPFNAGRYHSLVADRRSLPDCLTVSAWLTDGTVMAVRHRERPMIGVQFHPEAILTQFGYQLLANFLEDAGMQATGTVPHRQGDGPVVAPVRDQVQRPITF